MCVAQRKDELVPLSEADVDKMSIQEIKKKLGELNIKTRVRRIDKSNKIKKKMQLNIKPWPGKLLK